MIQQKIYMPIVHAPAKFEAQKLVHSHKYIAHAIDNHTIIIIVIINPHIIASSLYSPYIIHFFPAHLHTHPVHITPLLPG